ncbi:MAG: sigma-E processing peptidase SpoIIGA [Oscillospiraceae bacterium]|nr:sigma-E processing peptidase SpoIIGA [Oscillospiraceae bacterium]
MENVIYIDVLLIINLFVNYFLLAACAKLIHIKLRRMRMLLGAFAGSVSSLLILLPPFNFFLQLVVKITLAMLIIYIAFGITTFFSYLRTVIVFFGINFVFAGVMFAIWFFLPLGIYYNNGLVYFNISAITLIVSTVTAYLLISLASRFISSAPANGETYTVNIDFMGSKTSMTSFLDTGNRLTDIFSGLPVVICGFDRIKCLIPEEFHEFVYSPSAGVPESISSHKLYSKIRLIPYDAIGNGGLIAAFKPDRFETVRENKTIAHNVLIGINPNPIANGEYDAILNYTLKGQLT